MPVNLKLTNHSLAYLLSEVQFRLFGQNPLQSCAILLIMRFRHFSVIYLLILSVPLVFSGCTPAADALPQDATPNLTATAQSQMPASTPTPTASPIPPPSPTPTRTPFPSVKITVEVKAPNPTAEEAVAQEVETPVPPTSTPEITNSQNSPRVEVLSLALNIREAPGLGAPVLRTAFEDDVFEVTGRDQSGNWLQITVPNGEIGWISGGEKFTRLIDVELDDLPVVEAIPQSADVNQADVDLLPDAPIENDDNLAERLVFATSSGGSLYSVNLDGSGLRQLAGGVIDPAVSPDGKQVAFTRWDGAEFGALYVVNLADGSERAIVGNIRQPKSPTWSPDGSQIVISFQHGGLRDPKRQCRTFEPGEKIRIPDNAEINWAKVRPNGNVEICFTRREDLQWRLRQIDVSTGEFEDLPSDEYAYNPTWDPQNPWRVIYSGNKGLMQFDVDSNRQNPVTTDLRDTEPVFSPEGTKVAITYKQHDHWEVYSLDLESGARTRLTKPPILADPQYSSAAPAWSPDGSQITFLTDRSGEWEIWVMNADGANQRPLLPPQTQEQLTLSYNGVNERLLNWLE